VSVAGALMMKPEVLPSTVPDGRRSVSQQGQEDLSLSKEVYIQNAVVLIRLAV